MSDFGTSSKYRVRGGFLVRKEEPSDFAPRARALDAYRRPFSPDNGEDDPDQETIEIHNHIPGDDPEYPASSLTGDDEEGLGEGEEIARYPANGFTVMTEDDESGESHHVVYRSTGEGRAPSHKSDIYEMGDSRARDARSRAPRTLAELNASNAAHYKAKAGRR
jgi:hypothetical protein